MKLGPLNAAIDAVPNVYGLSFFGKIAIQKGSLKQALKEHFSEGRSQETKLTLNEEGILSRDLSVDP